MDLKLPDLIIGPDDLQLLELEIDQVLDYRREQAMRKSTKSGEHELTPQLQGLLELKPNGGLPNADQLEQAKQWVSQARQLAPVVHITFPGVLTDKAKIELTKWFRQEISPITLMIFEYNRGLAGGFALRLGSQIFDYSFRHLLLSNPKAMVKVMKHV